MSGPEFTTQDRPHFSIGSSNQYFHSMGSTLKKIEWQGLDEGKCWDSFRANRMIGDFVRPSPPKNL